MSELLQFSTWMAAHPPEVYILLIAICDLGQGILYIFFIYLFKMDFGLSET